MGAAGRESRRQERGGPSPLSALWVALLLASGLCSQALAEQWPGWRGLQREGRSETPKGPVHWSASKNVVWKTPIPGAGKSSPVVSKDSVVVTTAYLTEKAFTARRMVWYGVIALTAVAVGLAVPFLIRSAAMRPRLTKLQFLGVLALAALLGGLIHVVFVGHAFLGVARLGHDADENRWLLSAVVGGFCLMLAAFVFVPRSRARLLLGVAAVGFSVFALLARPNPGYYRVFGQYSVTEGTASGEGKGELAYAPPTHMATQILGISATPLVVGLGILLSGLLRRKAKAGAGESPEGHTSKRAFLGRLALLGVAMAYGLVGFRLNVPAAADKLYYHLRTFDPAQGSAFALPPALLEVALFALAIWVVVEAGNLRPAPARLTRWFALAILLLSAASLAEKNYLGVKKHLVRAIVCLDRATGAVRWVREGLEGPTFSTHSLNSLASPTPLVDSDHVYAYFGTPGLLCTDLAGKVQWVNRDLPFEHDIHGVGASPILADGLVVINNGQPPDPYAAAIDCKTGKAAWSAKRPPFIYHGEHRTPTIVSVDGSKAVLIWGWDDLRAYDLLTGKELATRPIDRKTGEVVAGIISDGDTLYLPNQGTFRAFSLSKLVRGEDPLLWATNLKTTGPNTSSPVLCNGLLFMVSDYGWAACLDAKTGELLWKDRLTSRETLASLIAIGGNVYLCDGAGVTRVIAAEPQFRLVAENELGEAIHASPAPVDGQLFIRTAHHVWCIEEK